MGIIYQKDKRSGITYAYENKPYWDKEKKQSRAKRELIGRVHPETGEIVPTNGLRKKADAEKRSDPDYKKLFERLEKKCKAQQALISSLQRELKIRKGTDSPDAEQQV